MARTSSIMPPLGFTAPDFTLPEPLTSAQKSLAGVQGQSGTLVIFGCNHCPFVLHIEDCLIHQASEWQKLGIGVVAISANDVSSHPQDGPEEMARRAKEKSYTFSYLYDESQAIAKAYQAACTPDFFLFDKTLACVYRGQFDDSRPDSNIPVSGASLDAAISELLATGTVSTEQKPSIGCNIKWRE